MTSNQIKENGSDFDKITDRPASGNIGTVFFGNQVKKAKKDAGIIVMLIDVNNVGKKILVLFMMFFLASLVGCGNADAKPIKTVDFEESDTFRRLNQVSYPESDYSSYDNIMGAESRFVFLRDFMNKTAKSLFVEDVNYIYSPISLYMALAMLAEGAEG